MDLTIFLNKNVRPKIYPDKNTIKDDSNQNFYRFDSLMDYINGQKLIIENLCKSMTKQDSTIDQLQKLITEQDFTINHLYALISKQNSTINQLYKSEDRLKESNNTQTNYMEKVLSVRDMMNLAYQMGIIIKIGLVDGYQFEGIVERLWDETVRMLVQTGDNKHRMIIQIDRITFVSLS